MTTQPKGAAPALGYGVMPVKIEGQRVFLIDQRCLPEKVAYFDATNLDDMCFAIKEMVVRGAPSIGVAAAFGMACEAARLAAQDSQAFAQGLARARTMLDATRPTAVNLTWATKKMFDSAMLAQHANMALAPLAKRLFEEAQEIMQEHVRANKAIGEHGAGLVAQDAHIITHCNAGPLAVCGWGTALGVIRSAYNKGLNPTIYVDETRPRNQGAKLTMWELKQDDIAHMLICDSMSGFVMARKKVDLVVVGADRIAANGDTANKIGTYNLAVLAKYHQVPFYVAAPLSTFDLSISSGAAIPIEERDQSEMTQFLGLPNTYEGAHAFNPAFDVTPNSLISAIITERGVLYPPFESSIAALDLTTI